MHEPIVGAVATVHQTVSHLLEPGPVEQHADLETSLVQGLLPQLSAMLGRATLLEVRSRQVLARPRAVPFGQAYDELLTCLDDPAERAALNARYPGAAPLVRRVADRWTRHCCELVERLADDERLVRDSFGPGCRADDLVHVDPYAGDRHRGGRAVAILTFGSGQKLVYKPRSLALDGALTGLLDWLDGHGLPDCFRLPAVVPRPGYGWAQHVGPTTPADPEQRLQFARRLGVLLGVFYVLGARDFHHENLVFHDGYPVPLDLEVVLESELAVASPVRRSDVTSSGILPSLGDVTRGPHLDISFLGYAEGQQVPFEVPHLVRSPDADVDVVWGVGEATGGTPSPLAGLGPTGIAPAVDAIVEGFERGYEVLSSQRQALLAADGPLAAFNGLRTRLVVRPTVVYAELLRESFHPSLLRGDGQREQLLDRLGAAVGAWQGPLASPALLAEERRQLEDQDVPYLEASTTEEAVFGRGPEPLDGVSALPGLVAARNRLRALSSQDEAVQCAIVRGSFSAYGRSRACTTTEHDELDDEGGDTSGDRADDAIARELDLLAERISQLYSPHSSPHLFTQLDLGPSGALTQRPVDLSLYDGLAGIALALVEVGSRTANGSLVELGCRCLEVLRSSLGTQGPDRPGAFTGWGGVLYALCRLRVSLGDESLQRDIDLAFRAGSERAAVSTVSTGTATDLVSGLAGWVCSLHACRDALDPGALTRQVEQAGNALLASARTMRHGVAWAAEGATHPPLGGLSHGTSGVLMALSRAYAITGAPRFAEAYRAALEYDRSLFDPGQRNWRDLRLVDESLGDTGGMGDPGHVGDPGHAGDQDQQSQATWCHGAPGVALSRLSAGALADEPMAGELVVAGRTTTARGMPGSHCLCHGWLGNLDVLLELEAAGVRTPGVGTATALVPDVLSSLRSRGWICGGVLAAESVGLMTGLSGIAYGLLRLRSPHEVPSVLALQPS